MNTSIDDPAKAMDESLERLGLDYVDMYLIHDPFCVKDMKASWKAMELLVAAGKTKYIGVSNFRVQDFKLFEDAAIKPIVNQIEYHAYLQQPELLSYMHQHGIQVEAYGALLPIVKQQGGPVDAVVQELANKYGRTPEQILIRWVRFQGHVAVTTSSKVERMQGMLDTDFHFEEADATCISQAGEGLTIRRFWATQYPKE